MKNLLALSLILPLAGCASFDAAVSDFNSPATQQALSTVLTTTANVACIIQGTANQKTVLYAVTKDACMIAGGYVATK